MAALRRMLTYAGSDGDIAVPVIVGEPVRSGADWRCDYEIGWPAGIRRSAGYGVDAIQAVELTLQMIGAEIYTSDEHLSGGLRWQEAGQGYGFPVSRGIRDLLIGDDARFFR